MKHFRAIVACACLVTIVWCGFMLLSYLALAAETYLNG